MRTGNAPELPKRPISARPAQSLLKLVREELDRRRRLAVTRRIGGKKVRPPAR
jgi:hypothetical protein